ncbi:MAG: pyridoxal 5'-phosphate synthase glutaminase subunit PdxT [Bacilli bacterium]
MRIAVLALQGAFLEHEQVLDRMGIDYFEIRQQADLEKDYDGLILPGGESTTMGKLLRDLDLFDDLKQKIEAGLPVLGTCAGLILLAKKLTNSENHHFATMDVRVVRNAYGRQLGSFTTDALFHNHMIPMVFIRAPYIESVGLNGKVLATVDGKIVAAQVGNQLGTAFHPELTNSNVVFEYFINIIKNRQK